ncbi:MAG: hypothetical protein OEW39_06765 [Deltaproteobacteria bacterium]|nr:hypothetical protein [Deltaproteobacteria bacterium]
MKLPLRIGLPLLGVALVALMALNGPERTLLIVLAMGIALWTAFSLPHPGPKPEAKSPFISDKEEEPPASELKD